MKHARNCQTLRKKKTTMLGGIANCILIHYMGPSLIFHRDTYGCKEPNIAIFYAQTTSNFLSLRKATCQSIVSRFFYRTERKKTMKKCTYMCACIWHFIKKTHWFILTSLRLNSTMILSFKFFSLVAFSLFDSKIFIF